MMAMFPAVMNDTMFADLFDDPFFSGLRNAAAAESVSPTSMMSTDVRETDKSYEVAIDMPGFNKDDIAVELHDGYLSVTAHKDEKRDDKGKDGKWLRRERYVGSCSRSFYVGDDVKDSDVTASYKDGTLSLSVAKVAPKAQVEDRKRIAIEG